MREPVAKRSPKHRGRVGNTDHLAVVQPVRHDARRQENLRIAILVAFEEKNVPKQKQEFRASPAMWDVAHVPKPVRHLAEIFGDGITMLLVPRAEHDLPGTRRVFAADLRVRSVTHDPLETLVEPPHVPDEQKSVRQLER